jgi:hypothetical protein
VQTPKQENRGILRITLWTLGILVALFFAFLAANTFDEDPSPETKALLIAPSNPYKPEENLYLALLGLLGPRGASPVASGEQRVAAYERDLATVLKDPRYKEQMLAERRKQKGLEFQGKVDFFRPLGESGFAELKTHDVEVAALLRANRELMQRYSGLRELKGYHETATPSMYPLPMMGSPAAHLLYLADIALRAKTGARPQEQAALASLSEDIRVWRAVLVGSGSLVSKMVAVANLHRDDAVLADIIADGRFDAEGSSSAIRAALDLVAEDDWKIGSAFLQEFRANAFFWDVQRLALGMRAGPTSSENRSWGERLLDTRSPFLKINAAQNLQARDTLERKRVADAPPKDFFAARDAYRKWLADNVRFGLHYFYDPFGKFLANITAEGYLDYIVRAYDGAAFQRLVRLGHEIRSQRIPDGAIPSFIEQHPEWASHPVDGSPFVWNAETREIAVQTLGNEPEGRRFSISVWSVAARP